MICRQLIIPQRKLRAPEIKILMMKLDMSAVFTVESKMPVALLKVLVA